MSSQSQDSVNLIIVIRLTSLCDPPLRGHSCALFVLFTPAGLWLFWPDFLPLIWCGLGLLASEMLSKNEKLTLQHFFLPGIHCYPVSACFCSLSSVFRQQLYFLQRCYLKDIWSNRSYSSTTRNQNPIALAWILLIYKYNASSLSNINNFSVHFH